MEIPVPDSYGSRLSESYLSRPQQTYRGQQIIDEITRDLDGHLIMFANDWGSTRYTLWLAKQLEEEGIDPFVYVVGQAPLPQKTRGYRKSISGIQSRDGQRVLYTPTVNDDGRLEWKPEEFPKGKIHTVFGADDFVEGGSSFVGLYDLLLGAWNVLEYERLITGAMRDYQRATQVPLLRVASDEHTPAKSPRDYIARFPEAEEAIGAYSREMGVDLFKFVEDIPEGHGDEIMVDEEEMRGILSGDVQPGPFTRLGRWIDSIGRPSRDGRGRHGEPDRTSDAENRFRRMRQSIRSGGHVL